MRVLFFREKKLKKKPCMFIVLERNILSTFFFLNIPKNSDEHGWVFLHKKKRKKIPKHVFGT